MKASFYKKALLCFCAFDVFVERVQPSCTTSGYDVYRCAQCEATTIINPTQPLGAQVYSALKEYFQLDGCCERNGECKILLQLHSVRRGGKFQRAFL